MSQVEYQDDPSMEEILASIRRIITEEKGVPSLAPAPSVDVSFPENLSAAPNLSAPLSALPKEMRPNGRSAPPFPPRFLKTSCEFPGNVSAAAPVEVVDQKEETLSLGQRKKSASQGGRFVKGHETVSSCETKSARFEESSARVLENFFLDALRPLIREWLDNHMPDLVKQIAAEHVEEILYKKIFK